jgi:flagellar basal-body rod protein FlgB
MARELLKPDRRGKKVIGMLQGIVQSSSIPVLEQVVRFSQARHTVLAGNLANLHTPGYRVRDLSVADFQSRLKEAIGARGRAQAAVSPGMIASRPDVPLAEVAEHSKSIVYHDDSNIALETQVTEMVKNQIQHNLALAIMASQFRLLEAAISERA